MRHGRIMSRSERGFGLVETLVAVALLGSAVTTFLVALSTGSLAVTGHEVQAVAQELAQTQLEYIKSLPYNAGAASYPVLAAPDDYIVGVTVSPVAGTDAAIQAVTVTINRDGAVVLTVQDYKVDR